MHEHFNEDELSRVYQILGHPLRRKIISYLGRHGKASFTELRRNLKVSVGTLYYNLDQLRGFITQDSEKKYMLTEKGTLVYEVIKHDVKRLNEYARLRARREALGPVYDIFCKIFLPSWISQLNSRLSLLSSLALISLALGLCFSYFSNLELSLFFYYPSSGGIAPIIVNFMISLLAVFFLFEVLIVLFHGERGSEVKLFLSIIVSFLPLLLYPLLYKIVFLVIPANYYIYDAPLRRYVIGALLLFLQLLTMGYLTTSISSLKGIRIERAFIIVSIVYYLSMMYNILFRQSFLLPL